MTEEVSLADAPVAFKLALIEKLGLKTDGIWVLNPDGSKLMDEYANKPIRVDRMIVLPGSIVVLDDNPLSITSYFEEHGDLGDGGTS